MILVKKHRIYPTKNQQEKINFWFRKCNMLYNASIEERVNYYNVKGKYYNMYEQKKELVDIKKYMPEFNDIPNKSLQEIIIRSDKSFKSFFNNKNNFPKYSQELKSLFFVKTDIRLNNDKLYIPKIKESIKYKEIIKLNWTSVRLIRENNNYYLNFTYDYINEHIIKNDLSFRSFDLGLMNLYVDNYGNKQMRFDIKLYKKYQKRIKELNKSLSKKLSKKSKRRNKVKNQLIKTYKKLSNTRKDYNHKISSKLIKKTNEYNLIFGDIKIKNIVCNKKSNKNLRRSFYNSSLNMFKNMIKYKGLKNDKNIIFVNESWTSKTCNCCGKINHKLKLNERIFKCSCGNCIDRDYNSAINIGNVWLGQFNPIGLNSHE